MKNKLRIVFMGTPNFAVGILKKLLDHKYNIVGVITAPDRPAGRGQKLQESSVKVVARQYGLSILQPTNLKNEMFLKALNMIKPELQIIVAFRMLPKIVWQIPQYGTFNLHASLLPDYRGAAPINWAIINGESKTGVTTFFIDDNIDTGDLILQEEVTIAPDETAGTLHDKLMDIGGELVINTVELIINGEITSKPQIASTNIKLAQKLNKQNCKIDWNASKDAIYNKVRGLNPYPTAWSYLKNGDEKIKIKIYEVSAETHKYDKEIGKLIISKTEICVVVKDGCIKLNEFQLPGKRRMPVKDILNGYDFESDAKML